MLYIDNTLIHYFTACMYHSVVTQQDGDLRLVSGSSSNSSVSGRLEVYVSSTNEWGTVCLSGFALESANASCRQLGYAMSLDYGEAVTLG